MSDRSPTPPSGTRPEEPRDAAFWARAAPSDALKVSAIAPEAAALNRNVEGRHVVGPLQGFGPLWQKTYRIRLPGNVATPTALIRTWKEHFGEFWPAGSRFFAPLRGLAPGEVAVLNLGVAGGLRLSTGVLVLYADEDSFTLMTPQGHMFAGWVTFSAAPGAGTDDTVAQVQIQMRASDPLYELGLRLGGHTQEDAFWQQTLTNLAAYFGVTAPVQTQVVLLDPKIQWSQAKNVWYNAALRSTLDRAVAPLRRLRRLNEKRAGEG